ncbi:hypothetical protein [Hazenella coriacea]|uniref:Uncharacterized protein n=1 Tax=Hazenella coriacea TaxID=1179467 RepID=A0A4R3L567_9BACL|nr:hypothetical protein [Hazenella coriacea]TCS92080.1 hypothetical protein EDD58_1187 [Hazenella coriacea]
MEKKTMIIYGIMMSVGVFVVMMIGAYVIKKLEIEYPISSYLIGGVLVLYILIMFIVFVINILKRR